MYVPGDSVCAVVTDFVSYQNLESYIHGVHVPIYCPIRYCTFLHQNVENWFIHLEMLYCMMIVNYQLKLSNLFSI